MRRRRAFERSLEPRPSSFPSRTAGGGEGLSALLFGHGELGFLAYPAAMSNVYQDTAGATPVTADNDPVGRFVDQSGNGNHATNSTADQRPLWKANSGKPYLLCDGTDDRLTQAYVPNSAGTIAVAFQAGADGNIALAGGTTTGNKRCRIAIGTSGAIRFDFNTTGSNADAVDHRGQNTICVMTWGGGVRRCYIDSQTPVVDEAAVANMDGAGSGFCLGAAEGGGSGWLNGRIYAALARGAISSPAECSAIIANFQRTFA